MHESLKGYLDHVEAGRIRMVTQDELVLFNYTDQCTFEKVWDEYTLNARGNIFHAETGAVVARPFSKFFNYTEHQGIYGDMSKLLESSHYIQQKLDGSLGIIYWYQDSWRVATRGSFSSDQAIRGAEILKKYNYASILSDPLLPLYTLLVEIIYPENKIIVPYGSEEKLVLLAARHKYGGDYVTPSGLDFISRLSGIPLVKHDPITIEHALSQQKTIPYTEEGWVVVFECGTRLKIKGDDYMRIAKFKANLSPLAVWEALSLGRIEEMLVACPEECREEMEVIQAKLVADFTTLKTRIRISSASVVDWGKDRKTAALQIQTLPKWMHGALFGKLSGGELNGDYLWKILRPIGNVFVNLPED